MINVMQHIYTALTGDSGLAARLSTYNSLPAVFLDWSQQVQGPYIVLTYLPASEVFQVQVAQTLQIDIFERGADSSNSYTSCLLIRNELVRILDELRALDGVENLRVYYDSEQTVSDDDGRYRRYMLSFAMRWNRTTDL